MVGYATGQRRIAGAVHAMSPVRALTFAALWACAAADTRAPPDTINDDVFHTIKIPVTNTTPGSDVKVYDFQNTGSVNDFGFSGASLWDAGLDPDGDVIYRLSDEEYYEMPHLFHLDEYVGCLARRGAYCLGSFELSPNGYSPLFNTMQRYSANWVDYYNHTRLHRGVCLTRSCAPAHRPALTTPALKAWFASCVNTSTMAAYNLSARLYRLEYCRRGPERAPPLNANERGFAGFLVVLFGLAMISTVLDLTLTDQAKKGYGWALSWSVRSSWRALTAPAPVSQGVDLRVFDGLRVFCMLGVILEHVTWLAMLSYVADTRAYEQMTRSGDVILMINSSLVVQIFFIMASFLLAHKLLKQRSSSSAVSTFFDTMFNRLIRICPSYFVVVWFASSWFERLGSGPQWSSLVGSEAKVCRRKWWTHLLFLNNVVDPDEKCLIQTWSLAADMQLYMLALVLTLALRGRRHAVSVLCALLAALTGVCLALAYAWRLMPTYVVHHPETIRVEYRGNLSFNLLYQSPLGNSAGALAGLLLAHVHHALSGANVRIADSKWFRWSSVAAAPAALLFAAWSPLVLGEGPPRRAVAAVLAAVERPVFAGLVALALLGAMHGVKSPWGTWLSSGGTVLARLSFGALLLNIPVNKWLLAARLAPSQIDRQNVIFEFLGAAIASYLAAVPLALLVELPVQRLHKELSALCSRPPPPTEQNKSPQPTEQNKSLQSTEQNKKGEKTDHVKHNDGQADHLKT
ncbi:O-acyltransferase like protein [Bicyclus anynana]|uniref:O-acyltransferase like protein n=1 Tax=Bicyclus anynana TaxID=110368 RepID=A0A6J1N588_BICAN|nr:O-acyltransferase like protein [Bicyclus anynana]